MSKIQKLTFWNALNLHIIILSHWFWIMGYPVSQNILSWWYTPNLELILRQNMRHRCIHRLLGVLPDWIIDSPLWLVNITKGLPSKYIQNFDTATTSANASRSRMAYLISAGVNLLLIKRTGKYSPSISWQRQQATAKLEESVKIAKGRDRSGSCKKGLLFSAVCICLSVSSCCVNQLIPLVLMVFPAVNSVKQATIS